MLNIPFFVPHLLNTLTSLLIQYVIFLYINLSRSSHMYTQKIVTNQKEPKQKITKSSILLKVTLTRLSRSFLALVRLLKPSWKKKKTNMYYVNVPNWQTKYITTILHRILNLQNPESAWPVKLTQNISPSTAKCPSPYQKPKHKTLVIVLVNSVMLTKSDYLETHFQKGSLKRVQWCLAALKICWELGKQYCDSWSGR